MIRWPWNRRVEEAHREVVEAAREREEATAPLQLRAQAAVRESLRHRNENHFRDAIEELMRSRDL